MNNVVDNGDGSWTINFSDGTSVTIRNGQDGEDGFTPPSITVVEEDGTYYWAYEDEDGNTEFILDDDGNKIPVSGEAPQVRINEDGYWEISSDGGKTWENTNVKAEGGDGDSFFSDVYVEGGILYLVLADGTVIEVPMTAELMFDFGTDGDTLYFTAGESKTLDYTMSGAETYTITKPDGWRASIEGNGLVITAPASENTFAETEGTISVILFGANGQSFLAEMPVVLGEDPDAVKVVEFPDPVLKAYLVERYDSNGDGEIDTDEAGQVTEIIINTAYSTDDQKVRDLTGLDKLINLETISLQGGLYTEIDLTPFTKLQSANVKISKQLTEVKVTGNVSITSLDVTNTAIDELDLTGCVSLTTLTCGSLNLTSISDFITGGGESLQIITSTFNNLTSLDMKRFPELTNLDIQYNEGDITSVDFSANTKLNSLAISNSSMPVDLDLSACPDLGYVKLTSCGITSIVLPEVSNISTLEIGSNELSELNLSGAANLSRLLCNSNNLTSLDLSSCNKLDYLDVRNNSLTDLNIDGCTAITYFSGDNNQLSDASIFYQCSEITHISLPGNNITSFDPSRLTKLGALDLADNDLTGEINVSTMPSLNMQVDVTDNPSLEKLYISEGQAAALEMPFFNVQIKWDEETTEVLIVDENGEVIPNPGA